MVALRFTLGCIPTAQARVRHMARKTEEGKTVSVAYKCAGQKAAEAELDDLLKQRTPEKPLEGPLGLEFVAGMPILRQPQKTHERPCYGAKSPTRKSRTSTIWQSSSKTP